MQREISIAFWIVKYKLRSLDAACDFQIVGLESDRLVEWIPEQRLPFDSLYYYSSERPVHISYSPQHKRSIWAFTSNGVPTKKGIEKWINHPFQ